MVEKYPISIRRYTAADAEIWNAFIRQARNGNFLFHRGYMDYHADRFPDASFLFFQKQKICAVIPGTISKEGIFSSHAGLTFGGFVVDDEVSVAEFEILFSLLDEELRKLNVQKVIYKPLPWIFAERPSQEDLYWLFRKNATLKARLISSALEPKISKPPAKKRYYQSRCEREGLVFSESKNFSAFWDLLDACLAERHTAHPVHSKAELNLLASRFPENIRLFTVTKNAELLAGGIVYISKQVAHTQYLASSEKGRSLFAMDFLMRNLLSQFSEMRWFDWGTSNEEQGRVLHEGLAHKKEMYAGRGVAFDIYEYTL